MEYNRKPLPYCPVTVFVTVIGTAQPSMRIAVAFSRRDALDDLIAYLNMMMDEEVLPQGADEKQVRTAVAENLFQPVVITACE